MSDIPNETDDIIDDEEFSNEFDGVPNADTDPDEDEMFQEDE